jgi:hypothetical protein
VGRWDIGNECADDRRTSKKSWNRPRIDLESDRNRGIGRSPGGKEADGGGIRDVVTRDEKIHLMAVLADESPANETGAHQSSRTINRLDLTNRSGLVGDKISFVGSDRESAASVENDIDNVGTGSAGEKGGHEVGIEVGTCDMCVERQREKGRARGETKGKGKGWRRSR